MPKRPRSEVEETRTVSSAASSSTLRICVGSYEHVLYGIDALIKVDSAGSLEAQFNPVYMFEAHTAQIKSCAIGGRFLASGGVDEVLKLYDLKGRRDLGSLLSHDGTITTIQFSRSAIDGSVTHMLSGDENNRIIIWRCKDWTPLIQLTTRHGIVNDLSIHPSGKICISVGRDRNVRLWNLVTGKKAAAFKLGKQEPLKVKWNANGELYAILFDSSIGIFDMSASLQHSFPAAKTRFHDLAWFTRPDGTEWLVASQDDGKLQILNPTTKETLQTLSGHKTRVKALSTSLVAVPGYDTTTNVIVSGSTDGDVCVWAAQTPATEYKMIGRYNCGEGRITCLATCDAAIENIDAIVKRRIHIKEEDVSDDDVSVKSEEVEESLAELINADREGQEVEEEEEEEEFAGFD